MIEYVIDVIIIIISFVIFGYIHSCLAANKIKKIITEKFGDLIAFYRLFYNILTFFMLYLFYLFLPHPYITIYDLPSPYDYFVLIPQFLSLAGIIWAFKYFSLNEFLGIAQIRRWYNGEYNENELDEHLTLKIKGPYRFSRHPVYLFSILFLLFRPTMDLFYLILFICFVVYFYVGSYYEERKLVERFGKEYIDYQNTVSMIFPVRKSF
jgi:protein-S-isoprenylcysteine O-methyltransferase Ste14